MNQARYQELLGRLLDDELEPAQAKELARWLRANPAARSEVRRHLFLWEIYSQQRRQERSADAFVEACKTRIQAETDKHSFVGGIEARLRARDEETPGAVVETSTLLRGWLRLLLHPPRWALGMAATVLAIGIVVWLFPFTNHTPTLAFAPGMRVTLERGGREAVVLSAVDLATGDVLHVAGTNAATFTYGREPTRVSLSGGSALKIVSSSGGKRFELHEGKLEASVAHQRPFQPMILTTPTAEARVLGTKFTLTATINTTRLDVDEGKVRLTRPSDAKRVDVPANYYAIAAANSEMAALPQTTGWILREYWTNLPRPLDLMFHPAFSDRPHEVQWLSRLETTNGWGKNYAARWRGYLHPPMSGEYRLGLAATDDALLYLSPNDRPEEEVSVRRPVGASLDNWKPDREGSLARFNFIAGRRYYIEVLHKAAQGVDYLAVAWKRPDGKVEIIPGEYLSPFKPRPKETK